MTANVRHSCVAATAYASKGLGGFVGRSEDSLRLLFQIGFEKVHFYFLD